MNVTLKDCVIPQGKSKVKAGEGKDKGIYRFFTSSPIQSKYLDEFQYDSEALIFGTGGNASVHFCDEPFSTSTDCLVMYGKTDVNLKLIYYYLSGNIHLLQNGFKGAGLQHISRDYILGIQIPLPSRAQQDEIVRTLDMIADAESILNDEASRLDEIVKSRFVEMFGDPLQPKKSKPLGEVALLERGRFSPRPRNDPRYYNGDYPFVQTGDVANCDHRLSEYHQTLNEEGIKVSKCFYPGTILIALVGATIGATAILETPMYAPDSIIGITVNENEYNNVFMEALLQFWQPELKRIAPEAARANINLSILGRVPVIDVSIDLQQDFAAFVAEVDKSKLAVNKCLEKAEYLKAALMQEYFG